DRRNFLNDVRSLDLGTMNWTPNLPYTPWKKNTSELGYGPGRGICYDRDRHCIWQDCAAGDKIGIGGLWQGVGDLAGDKWKPIETVPGKYSSIVAYDEGARKLICLGFTPAGFQTQIYDPDANKVAIGSRLETEYADWGRDFPAGFQYVPEL